MELTLLVTLVAAFAAFVTTHLALAFGLAFRPPRWRAAAALVVLPLAPFWGFQERMRVRSVLWLLSVTGYAVALSVSKLLA